MRKALTCARRAMALALLLAAVGLFSSTALALDDYVLFEESLDEDLFSLDEDSLFGDGLVTDVERTADRPLEEVFLVRERLTVGGEYRVGLKGRWRWLGKSAATGPDVTLSAGGTLFVDSRPSRDVRFFAKAVADGWWMDGDGDGEAALHELFVDWTAGERVFFRIGKQVVHWGVGYFFSPADVINAGRIDPTDPDADREGATALRVHVPAGRYNYYGYVVVDGDGEGGYRVALAPKAEFVVGGTEVGVGLFYRDDRAPRAMATVSSSIGPVVVFGELALSKGSDRRFVRETTFALENLGLEVYGDEETPFVHATFGTRYTFSDPNGRFSLTAAAQYYYNGEGYDANFLETHGWKLPLLVEQGRLSRADAELSGRHYVAALLSGSHRSWSDLSVAALWLGSLTDDSGMVSLTAGYEGWEHIRPSISVNHWYGMGGAPLPVPDSLTELTVGVSVRGDF